MGFLDTIGPRAPQSRAQDSRSSVGQSRSQDDAPRAGQPAPTWTPQNDQIHPAVVLGAVLVVVAAVGVGGWLAVRDSATMVSPDQDAPPQAATPVEQPTQKRSLVRPRTGVRPVAKSGTAIAGGEVLADRPSEGSAPVAPATSPPEEVTEAAPTALEAGSDPFVPLPEDENVYSSEGDGVVAPRLTSLGFIRRPFNGLRVRTRMIELVVSKSGTVERAKISSTPAHWEDALILSRAKTFEFVPAFRNGFPVRYRFVMDVDSSP